MSSSPGQLRRHSSRRTVLRDIVAVAAFVAVLVLLIVLVNQPLPESEKLRLIRIAFAFVISTGALFISGRATVSGQYLGLNVRAVGALALFLVCILYNGPKLTPSPDSSKITGYWAYLVTQRIGGLPGTFLTYGAFYLEQDTDNKLRVSRGQSWSAPLPPNLGNLVATWKTRSAALAGHDLVMIYEVQPANPHDGPAQAGGQDKLEWHACLSVSEGRFYGEFRDVGVDSEHRLEGAIEGYLLPKTTSSIERAGQLAFDNYKRQMTQPDLVTGKPVIADSLGERPPHGVLVKGRPHT